jgi:hypothetical protein
MPTKRTAPPPTAKSIASYVKKRARQVKNIQKVRHGDMSNVREAEYAGHRIVVRTSYEIEVDGRMVMGHLGVTNDGKVHYHPIPNLSFASAIDMAKKLIDIFPDDFTAMGTGEMTGMHMKTKKTRRASTHKK